jgi:hypothetical protein
MDTLALVEAERQQHGLLARVEAHVLLWLARGIPSHITADHLTALGFAALLLAGVF